MPAQWGVWDERAYLLSAVYIRAIQDAGGLALMLPPDASAVDNPNEFLDLLDGLIIAEVEFSSEQAADEFKPPAWLGRELTDDVRFSSKRLALQGRPRDSGDRTSEQL